MDLLNGAAILDADDLDTRDVPVPEWGGTVRVRGLTGAERDAFEMRMAVARQAGDLEGVDFRAATAGRCMIDENGDRLFTDRQLPQLARKSAAALDRVFDVVSALSGLNDDVDELAGKSEATAGGDSHTG